MGFFRGPFRFGPCFFLKTNTKGTKKHEVEKDRI